nr:hypothetical protein [Actinomadura macra]
MLRLQIGGDLGGALVDPLNERRGRLLQILQRIEYTRLPPAQVLDLGFGHRDLRLMLIQVIIVEPSEKHLQTFAAVGAEDLTVEELVQPLHQRFLPHPDHGGMPFGQVGALRAANVVGVAGVLLAEHPPPTQAARHVGPQHKGPPRLLGLAPTTWATTGPRVVAGDPLRLGEDLDRHQARVGWLPRPHPHLGRVASPTRRRGRFAIPHHVAGVLGIAQDVADRGVGPPAHRPGLGRGDRCRIPLQIGVQTVSDLLVPHTFTDPNLEDRLDDRSPHLVGNQHVFGGSLFSTRRHRVRDLLGRVSVGWPPDVEALPGVDLEPAPGLLQHLQDIPLGNTLLDAPGQHLRRALTAEADRFIGCPQRDADLLQPVLDLGSDIGAARDPVDGLADHRIESPVRLGRLK